MKRKTWSERLSKIFPAIYLILAAVMIILSFVYPVGGYVFFGAIWLFSLLTILSGGLILVINPLTDLLGVYGYTALHIIFNTFILYWIGNYLGRAADSIFLSEPE